jgi:3-isopropylmalate/(R)-2-methylmalate dehydratase small subunit
LGVGDDVDTDLIYHNKYLAETDPSKMPQYAFEYYPGMEKFAEEVRPGDFVVAGKNFGCGSSRSTRCIAAICKNSLYPG